MRRKKKKRKRKKRRKKKRKKKEKKKSKRKMKIVKFDQGWTNHCGQATGKYSKVRPNLSLIGKNHFSFFTIMGYHLFYNERYFDTFFIFIYRRPIGHFSK